MENGLKSTNYKSLDPKEVLKTAGELSARVADRFPGSGLLGISKELEGVAGRMEGRAAELKKPKVVLRAGILLVCVVAALAAAKLAVMIRASDDIFSLPQFIQSLGSGLEGLAIMTAFAFFLAAIERRSRRSAALKFLSELRSMAHIIDLHQTKKENLGPDIGPTKNSPRRDLDDPRLSRYLEYCSEMLSIIGMVGSYYAQELGDEDFLESVDQLTDLTNGMASRILQKKASIRSK